MGAPRILAPTTISGGIPTAGAGTLNTVALWTPDGFTLGNSLLTQSGSVITNATGAIRANGTTQSTPAFMRYDATTSGIYFPATNEIGFTISSQHAMFISSGRLVGIGTTTPGAQLDVVGTTVVVRARASSTNTTPVLGAEPGMTLRNTNSTVGNYTSITNRDSNDNANGQINFINVNHTGSGAINFVTRDSVGGSAERVRITETGNVVVGTGSYAGASLGGIRVTNGVNSYVAASDGTRTVFMGADGNAVVGTLTAHDLKIRAGNADAITVQQGTLNVGIGTASPSYKLEVVSAEVRIGASAPGANTFLYLGNGVTSAGPYGVGALQFSGQAHAAVFANSGYGAARASLGMVSGGVYAPALSADPSGNVGIGTASPSTRLHVLASAAPIATFASSSATQGYIQLNYNTSTTFGYIGNGASVSGGAVGDLGIRSDTGVIAFATGGSIERARIDSNGNIYGTSGTTGMTNGFFYIPAAAGAPTGAPTAVSGRVPMYYDTTNNQFYVYNGAWKKVTLA